MIDTSNDEMWRHQKPPTVREVFQQKLGIPGYQWAYRMSNGSVQNMPKMDFLPPFDEAAAARNRG